MPEFRTQGAGPALAGDDDGEGAAIVLAHGLTATRRYVVQGSKTLIREGYRLVPYDARGHGVSDPAPAGDGYSYEELADDLAAVISDREIERPVLAGHSMGTHTIATLALRGSIEVAALVLVGPAQLGIPYTEESLTNWDELADGLRDGGVDGFLAAYERHGLDPDWRDVLIRVARERLSAHEHPEAVAEALREVPRSVPFDDITELETLDIPALVVASHDVADPGHPYAIAEAWAEALPHGRLVSEGEGDSPLAWQGGKLSREIAAFCAERAVAERILGS